MSSGPLSPYRFRSLYILGLQPLWVSPNRGMAPLIPLCLNYIAYLSETNLMSKVNSELAGMPGNFCDP